MAPNAAYVVANNILNEAKGFNDLDGKLFGDVIVLFGGDFRQLAPIPAETETVEDIHFRNSPFLEK